MMDLKFLEQMFLESGSAVGNENPLDQDWHKWPTVIAGLICIPVAIFSFDHALFLHRNNDNYVQYGVKSHDNWHAKRKLLLKEFIAPGVVLSIGLLYLFVFPHLNNEHAHFHLAMVGTLPYSFASFWKSYSLRINRRARRARGNVEESYLRQLFNFTFWLIRLNLPIAPLFAFALRGRHWEILAKDTAFEGITEQYTQRLKESHSRWILPGLTTLMLLTKIARLNRKKILDDMKRNQTSPFKTILSLTTAIAFSCTMTGTFTVFWPADAANMMYWVGVTNAVFGGIGIVWHLGNLVHWIILRRLYQECKVAGYNFQRKRKSIEFTFFLFLVMIGYLAGVNASLTVSRFENNPIFSKVCGFSLLFVYTALPIYKLGKYANVVHKILSKEAEKLSDGGEENTPYKKAMRLLERRANVERNGFVDVKDDEKHWKFDENEKVLERSNILQAAVIKVVVGNMREGWWWYKIAGLCERTALAIVVLCTKYVVRKGGDEDLNHIHQSHDQWGVSSCEDDTEFESYGIEPFHSAWIVLAIVFTGLVVTMFTRPYWDKWEDLVDIVSRLCVVTLALFGALLMSCVVYQEDPWLVLAINITGFATLFILVAAIGPVRVMVNTYNYQMRQYRARRLNSGDEGIEKMVEDDLKGMTPEEFLALSVEVRAKLVRHFPHYTPFVIWLRNSVDIEEYELDILEHASFVMGRDPAWLYCSKHGEVTGVESQGMKVKSIKWAGSGMKGEVPPQLSKLKKLNYVDLRFNAVRGGDVVARKCGIANESFLLDDDVEKVAVAECAFSMGRNIEWLLEGAAEPGTWPFRGVTVDVHGGKVLKINWSLGGLKGKLPNALTQLKWLEAVNLTGNELSEEVPPDLMKLSRKLGEKMKWGPAVTYLGMERQFYKRADVTEIIIPDSFEEVSAAAFRGCENLKKVTMGRKLRVIGEAAFFECTSLTELILPEGVEEIGDSAFYNSGLETVKLPSTAEVIKDRAFYGCKSLKSVQVNDTLAEIGKFAFADCPLLELIELPANTNIDHTTFAPATNCDVYRYDIEMEMFVRKTVVMNGDAYSDDNDDDDDDDDHDDGEGIEGENVV